MAPSGFSVAPVQLPTWRGLLRSQLTIRLPPFEVVNHLLLGRIHDHSDHTRISVSAECIYAEGEGSATCPDIRVSPPVKTRSLQRWIQRIVRKVRRP